MRMISRGNPFLKSILFYRKVRHSGGYGVHSPFAYTFISKVIKETAPYYSFHHIEAIRKQLLANDELIAHTNTHHPRGKKTVAQMVRKEAVSPKEGALLFRLAHYFKAKKMLQIGSTMGLSTLYITSYAADTRCISLAHESPYASIAKWVYEKAAKGTIEVCGGDTGERLKEVLEEWQTIDLVLFSAAHEAHNPLYFEACCEHLHAQSVVIVRGIKQSPEMRKFWKMIQSHPHVSVTFDLYALGIVLFNKKLHKHNYIVYF